MGGKKMYRLSRALAALLLAGWPLGAFAQFSAGAGVTVVSIDRPVEPAHDSYLVSTFKVLVGNAQVTSNTAPSVLAQLFSSLVLKNAKALALTVKFGDLPEVPMLLVERTSSGEFRQHILLESSPIPVLRFPGGGDRLTVRMRYTNNNDSRLLESIAGLVEDVGRSFGGIPVSLLTASTTRNAKQIDGIIARTFSPAQEYQISLDLSENFLRFKRQTTFTFFDRATRDGGARPLARLDILFEDKGSLFWLRPFDREAGSHGAFENPSHLTFLTWKAGPHAMSLNETMVKNVAFQKMYGTDTTADQYVAGCRATKVALLTLGLNEADVLFAYWAAVKSADVRKFEECPSEEDRARMAEPYGLQIALVPRTPVNSWEAHYKPTLDKFVAAVKSGSKLTEVASDVIVFEQKVPVFEGVEVAKAQLLLTDQFEALLSRSKPTEVAGIIPTENGEALIRTIKIGQNTYSAAIGMVLEVASVGPPQIVVGKVKRVTLLPKF